MKKKINIKPIVIVASTTAVLLFINLAVDRIDSGQIDIPEKYRRFAREANSFVRDVAKKILMDQLDNMF